MNKKEKNIINWKKMPIEDKILLVMEYTCYLLTIGALTAIIFVINKESVVAAVLLVLSMFGLIKCGLSARSSRDSFIDGFKINFNNKKLNRLLKLN